MEKVIKAFYYTFQCGKTETHYTFEAILKRNSFANYRIKATAIKFEKGVIKANTQSTLYFNDYNEMVQEFQFQYKLCKKSEFTKSLKIIK